MLAEPTEHKPPGMQRNPREGSGLPNPESECLGQSSSDGGGLGGPAVIGAAQEFPRNQQRLETMAQASAP